MRMRAYRSQTDRVSRQEAQQRKPGNRVLVLHMRTSGKAITPVSTGMQGSHSRILPRVRGAEVLIPRMRVSTTLRANGAAKRSPTLTR